MNRLTINQIAFGSLKQRRKQYRAIIMGAGMAIFFVTALLLSMQCALETYRLKTISRMGNQDYILRDAESVSPDQLLETGLVSAVGSMFVIAETEEGGCPIGNYDALGTQMSGRAVTEGRMPEVTGEIAVEPNFLQRLRIKANVGDELTLSLRIPRGVRAEYLPDLVEKTYTIVGILRQQSLYQTNNYYSDYAYLKMPSAIVSNDERVALGGREITHRMVQLKPNAYLGFKLYLAQQSQINGAMPLYTGAALLVVDYDEERAKQLVIIAFGSAFGLTLILSACLGIVNAFSSNLTERRNQIGMMRAVGATSRQIRRIFGREAIMLALIIAPAFVALAYGCVWAFAHFSELLVFYANPMFIALNALLSLVCVLLAAWIPLFGVSRISPMQAIRDVSLLRTKKRVKVRNKVQYSMPRLIASRHLSLYKTRQAGIALMVALSIFLISMAMPMALSYWVSESSYPFEIRTSRWPEHPFIEMSVNEHEGLTDHDVADMLGLPLAAQVDTVRTAQINIMMDEVTPYVRHMMGDWNIGDTDEPLEPGEMDFYGPIQQKWHLDPSKKIVPTSLFSTEDWLIETLEPSVVGGKIDFDALNAGREVISVAPSVYYRSEEWVDGEMVGTTTAYTEPTVRTDYETFTNDAFFAGDEVSFLRLAAQAMLEYDEDANAYILTDEIERVQAQPKIGAFVDLKRYPGTPITDLVWLRGGSFLTTHAGLAAMGIRTAGYSEVGFQLGGEMDDETYDYLADALKGIAARGTRMQMSDYRQSNSESYLAMMAFRICLAAVLMLLLSMCVSLVNRAITNRVRSDKRSIGTLRAVGASLQEILRSYQLQALAMIGWGILIGAVLSAGYYLWQYFSDFWISALPFSNTIGIVLLTDGAFVVLVALMCGLNLTFRIREITRDSIVTNIRDL